MIVWSYMTGFLFPLPPGRQKGTIKSSQNASSVSAIFKPSHTKFMSFFSRISADSKSFGKSNLRRLAHRKISSPEIYSTQHYSSSPVGVDFFFVGKKKWFPSSMFWLSRHIWHHNKESIPSLTDVHHIRVRNKWKSAFNTSMKYYMYLVVPLGLTNAPGISLQWHIQGIPELGRYSNLFSRPGGAKTPCSLSASVAPSK